MARLSGALRSLFSPFMSRWGMRQRHTDGACLYSRNQTRISPEKQHELNQLCEALLKKKELVASGKLQLLGLAKIRKRLGRRWRGLSLVVYRTVEEVLHSHLGSDSDFFVRYKDENYLIFFARTNLEESQQKTALIAQDIQQRLFELGEEELRGLEVFQHVRVLSHESGIPFDFDDFLESFPSKDEASTPDMIRGDDLEDFAEISHPSLACIDVEAEDCRTEKQANLENVVLPDIRVDYTPVWDVRRNSINAFLCLAGLDMVTPADFQTHQKLYAKLDDKQQAAMDIALLRQTIAMLATIKREGKKVLLVCPVQHKTLYNYTYFELYRALLQEIDQSLRPFLVIYVMDLQKQLPVKDAYWFVVPLKAHCRWVFAEVPLRQDVNFSYLKKRSIDAVGFRLGDIISRKLSVDKMINLFHLRATAMKVPMTFVFDLVRADETSIAAFTKYDYVAGGIILPPMAAPSEAQEFHSEDILLQLMKTMPQKH